jgi:hypothetical protein
MQKVFLYIFLLNNCLVAAQGFKVRHYVSGASTSVTKSIFEIASGNYIGAGIIVDNLSGTNRLAIMGLNSIGQILWTKKYGNSKLEYLNNNFSPRSFYKQGSSIYHTCCAKDSNGKYVGVLLKFNYNGDTIWQKIYRDINDDVIPQMLTNSIEGGFLITGVFQGNDSPCMLIKTDSNGNEIWRKKISKINPNVSDGKAIIQDSATKKIIIVGYQTIGNAISDNVLILDSLGNKLNQLNFGFPYGGYLVDLVQTDDKKIVAIGRVIYPQTIGGYNLSHSFALKFDLNNPQLPIWKIDNFDKLCYANSFHCIKELKGGDLLIGGFIDTLQGVWNGPNNKPSNYLTRYTVIGKNGNIKSNKYYDYKYNKSADENSQVIVSMELTGDGGWITSISETNFPNPNPMFFVKYDASGCDTAAAHCATVNIVGVNELKLDDYRDENEELKISMKESEIFIQNNSSKMYNVKVFNLYGALVFEKKDNYDNMNVNLANFESGIYLVRVENDVAVLKKKVLNLK